MAKFVDKLMKKLIKEEINYRLYGIKGEKMETYNLYATKKNGSYELICNAQTKEQAKNKAKRLSSNEYTSYLIVRKSKELGDSPVERGDIEDLEWER